MAMEERHAAMVDRIKKQFGPQIDLDKNPHVLVEILRNHGGVMDDDGGGGMGSGPDDGMGGAEGMGPGGPGPGDGMGSDGMGTDGMGGGGGVDGMSSIAVAGPDAGRAQMDEVMREVMALRKEMQAVGEQVNQHHQLTKDIAQKNVR